jgi:hypothetical protein
MQNDALLLSRLENAGKVHQNLDTELLIQVDCMVFVIIAVLDELGLCQD